MRIQNYRNFKDVEMIFDEKANYLVGENAIGKSGFLRLLALMSEGVGAGETDYNDPDEPIIITLELQLLYNKKEYFSDLPDLHRPTVRFRMEKHIEDIYPILYEDETNEVLPLSAIRRIRYLAYSSTLKDEEGIPAQIFRDLEVRLSKWGQAHFGDFMPETKEFIRHETRVGNFDSSYYIDIILLTNLLSRQDRPRADNMKFISLVALRIITQICIMSKSRAVPLEHNIIVDGDGKRYLPLIIAIDEPEIHLHPYMQRSVLDYYKQLLNNTDERFCQVLKDLFNIDGLRGQMFVVTHSTDSLVDDYRNIIRLYRNHKGDVKAACGANLHFGEEIEKHLIMHFPEVKEALYSRSVLIVEGETEYGCFRLFGETLDLPFDYYGICLINARGESSISKIKKLLEYFKIPTVALYDADVKSSRRGEKGAYFTDEICFEMDLTKTMLDKRRRRELDRIINTANGDHAKATSDMIKRACRKLDVNFHNYPPRMLGNVNNRNLKAQYIYYFSWLYSNKGVILGRLIGQFLRAEEIPPAFIAVIHAAGQLAKINAANEVVIRGGAKEKNPV